MNFVNFVHHAAARLSEPAEQMAATESNRIILDMNQRKGE